MHIKGKIEQVCKVGSVLKAQTVQSITTSYDQK